MTTERSGCTRPCTISVAVPPCQCADIELLGPTTWLVGRGTSVFPELVLPPLEPEDTGSPVCPLLLVPLEVEPTGCEPWTVPPLPLEPDVGLCAVCPDRSEIGGLPDPLVPLDCPLMVVSPRAFVADRSAAPLGSERSRVICSTAVVCCTRNAGCSIGFVGLTTDARCARADTGPTRSSAAAPTVSAC